MTQGVQDNRDFYRIQDQAILEFVTIDEQQLDEDLQTFPMMVSPQFHLLNELHSIEHDNTGVLRAIAEKDRDTAVYLKALNQKIDVVAHAILRNSNDLRQLSPQPVTLSEGGISFVHSQPITPDNYLALKLVLLPSYIGLLLYARVVNCSDQATGNYLINLVFERLTESNRQLIARHVLQFQAKQRRSSNQP